MVKYLFDFDSTLSATFANQILELNKAFGTAYTEETFTHWETERVLNEEESDYIWKTLFLSEDFQASCDPVPGAIEGAHRLLMCGNDAIVVSDRPHQLFDVTREWLDQQGLAQIPLIFTRNIHSLSDQSTDIMTKAQIAYLYKLTHVIEDAPHNALGLAQRSYIDHVYLLDKACNRDIVHPKIQRVHSWEEITCASL